MGYMVMSDHSIERRGMRHEFVFLQKGGTFVFCALSGALLRPESYPFGKGKYHHKAHISLLSWLPSGTYFVCDFSFFSFTLLDFVCFCHHLALLRLGRWPCLQNDFERCRWVAKKGGKYSVRHRKTLMDMKNEWYILHFRAKTWHSQSTVRPSWKFDRWKSTGKTRWHLETWEQHPGWSGWRGMTWRLPATDLRSRYRCLTCFKSKPRQLWRHLRAVWDGGFHRKNRDATIAGWLIYVDYCWFKCRISLWNQMKTEGVAGVAPWLWKPPYENVRQRWVMWPWPWKFQWVSMEELEPQGVIDFAPALVSSLFKAPCWWVGWSARGLADSELFECSVVRWLLAGYELGEDRSVLEHAITHVMHEYDPIQQLSHSALDAPDNCHTAPQSKLSGFVWFVLFWTRPPHRVFTSETLLRNVSTLHSTWLQ